MIYKIIFFFLVSFSLLGQTKPYDIEFNPKDTLYGDSIGVILVIDTLTGEYGHSAIDFTQNVTLSGDTLYLESGGYVVLTDYKKNIYDVDGTLFEARVFDLNANRLEFDLGGGGGNGAKGFNEAFVLRNFSPSMTWIDQSGGTDSLFTGWNQNIYYIGRADNGSVLNDFTINAGNVGIGTSTPDAIFDVDGGTVRFSDYGGGTETGTDTYLLSVDVDGDVLEFDNNPDGTAKVLASVSGGAPYWKIDDTINPDSVATDGYVSNVTLSGDTLKITGTDQAFDGDIDLSSIDGSIYTENGTLTGDRVLTDGGYDLTLGGLFIEDNGEVGIGTTSPSGKFHIDNNDAVTSFNLRGGASGSDLFSVYRDVGSTGGFAMKSLGGDPVIYIDAEGVWNKWYFGVDGTDGSLGFGYGAGVPYPSANSNAITLLNGGNVGIGTESPDALLDVEGGTVRFSDYGAGTNTGTETYLLAVDVDGDIIETSFSEATDNIYTVDGTLFEARVFDLNDNRLEFDLGGGGGSGAQGFNEAFVLRNFSPSMTWIDQSGGTDSLFMGWNQDIFYLGRADNGSVLNDFIINDGNVGIGTETPGAKFDVDGNVRFQDYGTGAVTGTETYLLAVDADGDIIESAIDIGTANVNIYNTSDTLTGTRTITPNGNDLRFRKDANNYILFDAPAMDLTATGLIKSGVAGIDLVQIGDGDLEFSGSDYNVDIRSLQHDAHYNLWVKEGFGTDYLVWSTYGTGDFKIWGDLNLDDYGTGSKTGTDAYLLAVEADGDVIESSVDINDVGVNIYNTSDTLTGNRLVEQNGNSLVFDGGTVQVGSSTLFTNSEFQVYGDTPIARSTIAGPSGAWIAQSFVRNGILEGEIGLTNTSDQMYFYIDGETEMLLDSSGRLSLFDYGVGANTGTVAKLLAVNSSGLVIETDNGDNDDENEFQDIGLQNTDQLTLTNSSAFVDLGTLATSLGWDTNASNDLTTATSFSGDVTGQYTTMNIATGVVGSNELSSTSVTPGSYTNTNITVDIDGRITAASSGSGGSAPTDEEIQDAAFTTTFISDNYGADLIYDDPGNDVIVRMDINELGTVTAIDQPSSDYIAVYDANATGTNQNERNRKISITNFKNEIGTTTRKGYMTGPVYNTTTSDVVYDFNNGYSPDEGVTMNTSTDRATFTSTGHGSITFTGRFNYSSGTAPHKCSVSIYKNGGILATYSTWVDSGTNNNFNTLSFTYPFTTVTNDFYQVFVKATGASQLSNVSLIAEKL